MSLIKRAGAWCNGEVAYLAWDVEKEIKDCVGFMVTRVHETGKDAGQRRILPTWIAFTDQNNPNWNEQDSSVWPIQNFQWRDLTLRKSRDTTSGVAELQRGRRWRRRRAAFKPAVAG